MSGKIPRNAPSSSSKSGRGARWRAIHRQRSSLTFAGPFSLVVRPARARRVRCSAVRGPPSNTVLLRAQTPCALHRREPPGGCVERTIRRARRAVASAASATRCVQRRLTAAVHASSRALPRVALERSATRNTNECAGQGIDLRVTRTREAAVSMARITTSSGLFQRGARHAMSDAPRELCPKPLANRETTSAANKPLHK
jgi:hypothetical protein